jgi:hypothetical protein
LLLASDHIADVTGIELTVDGGVARTARTYRIT